MSVKVTDEEIMEYVITHVMEDFPMDQTLEDFYKKVREWCDKYGNNK
ncbi:MAG: hypothetical protein IJH65_04235 [Methanobrevibacter sp.]|nr:hypothetical protein [Methanobrevibacter sp.]